jgi:hypothetical protein
MDLFNILIGGKLLSVIYMYFFWGDLLCDPLDV